STGRARGRLALAAGRLDSLSPLGVLARGYAIARRSDDGRIVRDPREVAAGDAIAVRVARGSVDARVVATRRDPDPCRRGRRARAGPRAARGRPTRPEASAGRGDARRAGPRSHALGRAAGLNPPRPMASLPRMTAVRPPAGSPPVSPSAPPPTSSSAP